LKSRRRVFLALLAVGFGGCAMNFSRDFSQSRWIPDPTPDLMFIVDLTPTGLLGWPDRTEVHIPMLLWLEYQNGPWTPRIKVKDVSNQYQHVRFSTITLNSASEVENVIPIEKTCKFSKQRHPDQPQHFNERLPFHVSQHEDVNMRIQGSALHENGKTVPFDFEVKLEATETSYTSDIFSIYASI